MAVKKEHESCAGIIVAAKELEHINKDVEKIQKHEEDLDKQIHTLQNELTEVKTVNTFLAQQVKDIINIKNKINTTIVKYFLFIIGFIILITIVKDTELINYIMKKWF